MSRLDDKSIYPRVDPSGMWQRIAMLSMQVQRASDIAWQWKLPSPYKSVDKIVLVGMGGSAVGGDLIGDLLSLEPGAPVFVVSRSYQLPSWVDEHTLVILCSHSGNTAETLAAFDEAKTRTPSVVVVSGGGKLLAQARDQGIPFIAMDRVGEPRVSIGMSLILPLALLYKMGMTPDKTEDLQEAVNMLVDATSRYHPDQPSANNTAKELAHFLEGQLVVIYGAGFLQGVARRWKTQVNENAKSWSFAESLPELNHNSVVGYEFPGALAKNISVILLQSSLATPEMAARYRATSQLLRGAEISNRMVSTEGLSPLAHMFTGLYLGDWVSYYLAILNGVDPSPVLAIDRLKDLLAYKVQDA